MKYFSPDIYARLQSTDPAAMDAADAAWQRAEEEYERRLMSIRPKLPQSALKILDETRLHDAEVLWMGRAAPVFAILLRLDTPSRATLLLNYFIAQPVQFQADMLPPNVSSPVMQWMYDEIDLGSQPGRFKHSILFSNGSQLEIEATEIQIATLDTLYSPALVGSVSH